MFFSFFPIYIFYSIVACATIINSFWQGQLCVLASGHQGVDTHK